MMEGGYIHTLNEIGKRCNRAHKNITKSIKNFIIQTNDFEYKYCTNLEVLTRKYDVWIHIYFKRSRTFTMIGD